MSTDEIFIAIFRAFFMMTKTFTFSTFSLTLMPTRKLSLTHLIAHDPLRVLPALFLHSVSTAELHINVFLAFLDIAWLRAYALAFVAAWKKFLTRLRALDLQEVLGLAFPASNIH